MGAFLGCLTIALVLALHGLDFLKELKLIRQELEKLNEKQDHSGDEDPLARACYRYLPELQHLVETGEVSEEIISHIDSCQKCRFAIDKVIKMQGKQFEALAERLHDDV